MGDGSEKDAWWVKERNGNTKIQTLRLSSAFHTNRKHGTFYFHPKTKETERGQGHADHVPKHQKFWNKEEGTRVEVT